MNCLVSSLDFDDILNLPFDKIMAFYVNSMETGESFNLPLTSRTPTCSPVKYGKLVEQYF